MKNSKVKRKESVGFKKFSFHVDSHASISFFLKSDAT